MADFPDDPLSKVRQRLLDGMVSFMQGDEEFPEPDFDCGYTQQEIDRCAAIVDEYLSAVSAFLPSDQEAIRSVVKRTVLKLNELNDKCDGGLIETDQREDLCELILVAAKQAGLSTDDDITYEWREW